MNFGTELGKRVRIAAIERELSLSALARRIPTRQATISNIVNGHTDKPNAYLVRRIAEVTGVTTDWLLGVVQREETHHANHC